MPIGRLDVTCFDCPDARALAEFYRSVIGGEIVEHPTTEDWVELHTEDGRLAFQQIPDHRRPTWPGGDTPQQLHIDVEVDDLDAGESAVLALGAQKAEFQPSPDDFRIFLDPAGHPFCLCACDT
jgi:catechol 2,3-dioxygenase-like lactoylglutathione lyase family enzyme